PAHGLGDKVVARALGVGPVLAEAGDRTVDQPRVQRVEALPVEAVLLQSADLEVLDQDVGLRRQAADDRRAFRTCKINGYGAFVAIAREVVGALAAAGVVRALEPGRAPGAGVVAAPGLFDLDHVSAEVGEDLGAPRPGQDAR